MNNQRQKQWILDESYFENGKYKGRVWFLPLKAWNGCLMAYNHNADPNVIKALHTLIGTNIRVRLYYGNPATGEAYYDRSCHYSPNDRIQLELGEVEEGYVDISTSEMELRTGKKAHTPMLMSFLRKDGLIVSYINHVGQTIRENQIVKIEFSNKKMGGVIWEHPKFRFNGEEIDKRFYYDKEKEMQRVRDAMNPYGRKKIA